MIAVTKLSRFHVPLRGLKSPFKDPSGGQKGEMFGKTEKVAIRNR